MHFGDYRGRSFNPNLVKQDVAQERVYFCGKFTIEFLVHALRVAEG